MVFEIGLMVFAVCLGPVILSVFALRGWPLEHTGGLASLLWVAAVVYFHPGLFAFLTALAAVWCGFSVSGFLTLFLVLKGQSLKQVLIGSQVIALQSLVFSALFGGLLTGVRCGVTSLMQ